MSYTITIAIIICALGIAFIEKKFLFSKPITAEKIWILALLIGTAIFSGIKETSNNVQQDHAVMVIDSLQKEVKPMALKVNILSIELMHAKKAIVDTVKYCSENGINQTKLTEQNITNAVAQGVKQGIQESRDIKRDIKKQIRDSINSLKPAYVQFLTEANKSVLVQYKEDTLNAVFNIINSGDLPAYNLEDRLYVFARTKDGAVFELKTEDQEGDSIPSDLYGNTTRYFNVSRYIDESNYSNIERFLFIVKGSYFLDADLNIKNKRNISIGRSYIITEKKVFNYSLAITIDSMLKIAPPVKLHK